MKRPKTFSELLETPSKFRWPKKGDRLLRASDDWDKSADFAQGSVARNVHIWTGYMRAGAALVEECERDSVNRHFLIYPILFLYRHGLEQAMKWTIGQYGRYADVSLKKDKPGHDLWKLWADCKKVIVEVGSGDDDDDDDALRVVQQIVKDFHDLDPTALAFRYSTTKKGLVIELPDKPVDLENLRDVMEAVDNFFTGVDGLLSANTSAVDW